MRKKKEDSFVQLNKNAGFSLVELLLAVIILAIIVVPLLHGFITSARMNGRAKQTQRATTVAQDIMEGLKAYDIEELKAQFNAPADGFYVMNPKIIHGSIEEDYFKKTVTGNEDEDVSYEHVGEDDVPDGIYYFSLEDVRLRGSAYDVLIRIDATNYMDGNLTVDGNSEYRHDNAFNNANMASPGSVIKGKDGNYAQSAWQNYNAAQEVWKDSDWEGSLDVEGPEIPFTFQTFKNQGGKVTRTITLTLEDGGTDEEGNPCCAAEIAFAYECTYQGETKTFYGGFSDKPVPCGDKIPEGGNIYLFYYPLYGGGDIVDKIEIRNTTAGTYTVYLIKQIDSVTNARLSDFQLKTAEDKYQPSVNITGDVEIRTNLGTNLVGAAYAGGGAPLPPGPGEASRNKAELATEQNNIDKQIVPAPGQTGKIIGAKKISGLSEGGTGEITEVIYDVEISVFKTGAKAKDFEDCRPMIVIRGSKNN